MNFLAFNKSFYLFFSFFFLKVNRVPWFYLTGSSACCVLSLVGRKSLRVSLVIGSWQARMKASRSSSFSGTHQWKNLSTTLDASGSRFPCLWGRNIDEVVGDTSVESGVLIRNHMTRGARGPLPFYLDRFQFQGGVDNMVVITSPDCTEMYRKPWKPEKYHPRVSLLPKSKVL